MALAADGAIEQITENQACALRALSAGIIGRSIPGSPINSAAAWAKPRKAAAPSARCSRPRSRMIPGDLESWHAEWKRIADRNWTRGLDEEAAGHIRTAMNCFLRAADYYRQAEFHLEPDDPRRLPTFEAMEACSHKFICLPQSARRGASIFPMRTASRSAAISSARRFRASRLPVLICMGGLDSIKDEMWFMQAHGCLQRGISVLMIDGPGQGGTLAPAQVVSRADYRSADRQMHRLAGDARRCRSRAHRRVRFVSLGGYYAARAGCYEHRLAAVHFAWRDLVGARHVGQQGRRFRPRHAHQAGCSARTTMKEPRWRRPSPSRWRAISNTCAAPISIAAWRPRRAHRVRGAQDLRLCTGHMASTSPCASRAGGNRRRALPARQSDHRPGNAGRLARRHVRHRPARAAEDRLEQSHLRSAPQ